MRRTLLALALCALAIVTLNVAALAAFPDAWQSLTHNSAAAESESAPSAQPTAEPSSQPALPIGVEARAAVDARAALLAAGVSSVSGAGWPSWCGGQPAGPWTLSGVDKDGTHLSVVGTSAGMGEREWARMSAALARCPEFRITASTADSVNLTRTDVPVTWVVLRDRDALVSAYRVGSSNDSNVGRAGQRVLVQTVASCSGEGEGSSRNPNFPEYQPYTVTEQVVTPLPVGPKKVKMQVAATWLPPEAVEHPELAELLAADEYSNPQTTDSSLAPTGPIPMLVDPTTVMEPTSARPLPSQESATAGKPSREMDTSVRTADTRGPGCGWSWAATTKAEENISEIAQQAKQARVQALAQGVSEGGQWFLAQAVRRAYAVEEATQAQIQADWEAYDTYMEQAQAAWDEAVQARAASEQQWNSWTAPPVETAPAPAPTPTTAPVPTPTTSMAPTTNGGTP